MPSADKPSLYERLGGVYSIATVIDDFIDRVMTDPRLNANPRVNEAHHRVPPAGFKYLATEMVCWGFSGALRINGWEAGTRTPIYRSRVFLNPNQINKIRDLARQNTDNSGKIRNATAMEIVRS